MRRIGILGGTFDPVHNGHLLLGEQAYREYGLDEIWFMPSHVPPHKKDHLITDGAARIRMLELATESIPYFTVSDFEMGREGNTYTAQTLALLKEAYPDIEVYFIIGADSLYQLETWYHPEQVMAQAVLLVSGRTYEDGGVPLEDKVAYFMRSTTRISGSFIIQRSTWRPRISGKRRQKAGIFQKTCRRLWRSISERQACI